MRTGHNFPTEFPQGSVQYPAYLKAGGALAPLPPPPPPSLLPVVEPVRLRVDPRLTAKGVRVD